MFGETALKQFDVVLILILIPVNSTDDRGRVDDACAADRQKEP